jgi:Bacterial protein of unknown function (DUF903)
MPRMQDVGRLRLPTLSVSDTPALKLTPPARRLDTERPAGIKRKLAISKMVRVVALALLFGLLADYASSHYIISTNSGTMIQTNGEPKFNKDTLMYEHEYEELDGNNGSIKQADATRSSSSSLA